MIKINLRDYYQHYQHDCFLEVSEEIAALLYRVKLDENAYILSVYRNKAFFSLDRGDGIEADMVFTSLSAEEIYERKVTNSEIHAAISQLPEKQAMRVYAYFFLGISKSEIAKNEGVNKSQITRSINKALKNIEMFLKKSR